MKVVRLSRGAIHWLANFGNDPEIERLFGTTVIPTPFMNTTDKAVVLRAIQVRNPERRVVIGGEI